MANPSKEKGDKAEREMVALLVAATPDLCVEKPDRMLGAGRQGSGRIDGADGQDEVPCGG